MKKFNVYVLGCHILIRIDHSVVHQLLNHPESTSRYARWVCILSEFEFTLQYHPRPRNQNADSLSRMKVCGELDDGVDDACPEYAFRAEIVEDPWYCDIIWYLHGSSLSDLFENTRRKIRTQSKHFLLKEGDLYRVDRYGDLKLCIGQKEVPSVLSEFHDSAFGGHWGLDITLINLKRNFFWPTMRQDVREHVRACDSCQRFRRGQSTNELNPTWVVDPFAILYVDWITKLPETSSGNKNIIVV